METLKGKNHIMEKEELEESLKEEHDRFLNIVYPYFGFKETPNEIKIKISDFGNSNEFDGVYLSYEEKHLTKIIIFTPKTFYPVKSREDYLNYCLTLAHESGHYLHHLNYNDNSFNNLPKDFTEFIAELSSISFMRLTERNIPTTRKSFSRGHDIARGINRDINILTERLKQGVVQGFL